MTREEAIVWLESLERLDKEQDIALAMAIEALQKQVPLTPTRKSVCSGWVQAMCPACNNVVYDSEGSDTFNAARHREWCIKCGQHFTMPAKMIGVWAKMEVDERAKEGVE